MKADKRLYTFFQIMNKTSDEWMKEFEAYIKVMSEISLGYTLMVSLCPHLHRPYQ